MHAVHNYGMRMRMRVSRVCMIGMMPGVRVM
jgi:hypothetical protein